MVMRLFLYVTCHIKRKLCRITLTSKDGINLPSWELCDCKSYRCIKYAQQSNNTHLVSPDEQRDIHRQMI